MIETPARVVRVEGATAWVRVESPASCGACGGKGCGSSLYARLLHPREPEYPVANPIAAEAGEAVVVGIEDGAVLRGVAKAYGLPLLLLLAGALLGARWGELAAVLGGLVGLLLAAGWLARQREEAMPAILRRGAPACAAH
jgi:sigma-E factor negative regulatory protein RseC